MIRFIALTTLSLTLAACGNKSNDPLKGYEEFSDRIPVGEQKITKQFHAVCGSKVTAEKLVVVEGQTASQKITVVGPNASRVGSFVIEEPITGASLVKVKQTKIQEDKKETANIDETQFEQEYKLTMKAARGTVAYGQDSKVLSTTIAPQGQINTAVTCSSPIQIEVQKIKGIPAIKSIDGATSLRYEAIGDVELTINVEAAEVTKLEDLTLTTGFDQSRQSKENKIININDLKPEISGTIPVAATSYQYKIKISGEALKSIVDKESDALSKQKKNRMFVDFHATFKVSNSNTKEKSLTFDYNLRIDRKPIEVAASPAPTTGAQ